MDRRDFLGVFAAAPIVAACQQSDPHNDTKAETAKTWAPLRELVVADDVEPAMTFVPLRQP